MTHSQSLEDSFQPGIQRCWQVNATVIEKAIETCAGKLKSRLVGRMTISDYSRNTVLERLGLKFGIAGGHSARSMMFPEMSTLVHSLPQTAAKSDFLHAIVSENILEKPTLSSRKNSLSHLIDLYGMDTSKALFRVLWDLGHEDMESLPQLCLVCSYVRDPQLRHSFQLVNALHFGEVLTRSEMEQHLESGFPGRFSHATKKSMAQNVNTTWTASGHLAGRATKTRKLPEPRPISAAYAMFVGYLTGLRGDRLLNSNFADLVASNRTQLQTALSLASVKGLLSLKQAADIVEFDFTNLLTPVEEALIHESH